MALKDQIGSFCWWSLMSKDVATANDFYQKLFDWKLDEVEIPGHENSTIYVAGRGGFANPVLLDEDFPAPSHWIPFVTVENVDESLRQLETLGGSVCVPATDIPTIGRTAVITDPLGAALHLFTPTNQDGELNMIGNGLGEICWMELMVDNPTPLFQFYSEMLGWTFESSMPMNGGDYTSFVVNGEQVGGLMKRPPDAPEMPPVWMNYFSVPSVDRWSDQAQSLGGQIIMPKMEIPETGYFACIEDPTGAHFYLFELLASS